MTGMGTEEGVYIDDSHPGENADNMCSPNHKLSVFLLGADVQANTRLCESLDFLRRQHHSIEVVSLNEESIYNLEMPAISCHDISSSSGDMDVDATSRSVYISSTFEGPTFDFLKQNRCKVIGPTCALDLIERSLFVNGIGVGTAYSLSLSKSVIVFSGFEKGRRTELSRLTRLAHFMGARVKIEINNKVTHLVSCDVRGSLYEDAVGLGIDILSTEWLNHCWNRRNEVLFCGSDPEVTRNFRLKPFAGLCLSFYGFAAQELKHMEQVALANGAATTDVSNSGSTHIIVDEAATSDLFFTPKENVWVVTSQWFWRSVQFGFHISETTYVSPQIESKKKKPNDDVSPVIKKTRASCSPKSSLTEKVRWGRDKSRASPPSLAVSKRTHAFKELVQTEKNYIEVLKTLIEVFKVPLEDTFKDKYGPFVTWEFIKSVFGALPDIYNIHHEILTELEAIEKSWADSSRIGSIYDKYASSLMKVYPNFINYLEINKDTITKMDSENTRFHAFLKCCQSSTRCGRQSLCELLIRPVQRLPSVILLFKELLKHTSNQNPDFVDIEGTIACLTYVMNHISEDKKKTEETFQIAEIYNNIDQCPAYFLSAKRYFVMKIDACEVDEFSCTKGTYVTVFILSDSIEIAKKRHARIFSSANVTSNLKPSPSVTSLNKTKTHKHCHFVTYKLVERVIDVPEASRGVWKNTFGLTFKLKDTDEMAITQHFRVVAEKPQAIKQDAINFIIKSVACARSLSDSEVLRKTEMGTFKKPDSPLLFLGKAIENLAIKTSRRMSRAFSVKNRSDALPRSVSVSSQIMQDLCNTPVKYRPRKSVQIDSSTSSLNFESMSLFDRQSGAGFSPAASIDLPKVGNVEGEKKGSRMRATLWRRSVQGDETKR